jgi:hypothetical protein
MIVIQPRSIHMPTDLTRLVTELSRRDLERLLKAKDRIEALEKKRSELQAELTKVDKELAALVGAATAKRRAPAKPGGKAAAKKAGKRTAKKKAATKKKAAKKTAKASASRAAGKKKVGKRTSGKPTKKAAGKPRATLEDVIVTLIEKHGGPMTFKEILANIIDGKLVKTRSQQFDNVLRRTLSTSERVKRVSRGVYGI